jgi:proteic killer suppression protein
VIVSFGDKATEDLFHNRQTQRIRRYPTEILRPALQKLDMLNSSRDVRDLLSPPGNRLELLKGNLQGYYSVRINERWRLIFQWQGADAHEVRIVDYRRG